MKGSLIPWRTKVRQIFLNDKDCRLREAHDAIERLHRLRSEPITALAVVREALHVKRDPVFIAGTIFTWLGLSAASQSLWFMLLSAPVALGTLSYKGVIRAMKVRKGNRGRLPPLPEFRNPWATMSHAFVRIIDGYNHRVEAVQTFRHDGIMEKSVERMARILAAVEPTLRDIKTTLMEFQPLPGADIFYEPQRYWSRLRKRDPLGDLLPAPPFSWLEAVRDDIDADDFERILEEDLQSIAIVFEENSRR